MHIGKVRQVATPIAIFGGITAYVGCAIKHQLDVGGLVRDSLCDGFGLLVILYACVTFGYVYAYGWRPYAAPAVDRCVCAPLRRHASAIYRRTWCRYVAAMLAVAAVVAFVVADSWSQPERLISAGGFIVFLGCGYAMSARRREIQWRIIVAGLLLQFTFGLLTLRWATGGAIVRCAGDKVTHFLQHAAHGAAFVYGDALVFGSDAAPAVFAFGAISSVYFLSFVISVLYHVGVMQRLVMALGTCLHAVLGTSVCESVNAAANIFLGMNEAPLLLQPYLAALTASELHALMTAGFASVSGTVLAAYVSFGAQAAHLITASVMAAPAGLVFAKLMLPDDAPPPQDGATTSSILATPPTSPHASIMEAGSQGALQATHIVLAIIANLVAFIACVHYVNSLLAWFGTLVGYTTPEEQWSIELLMGYVFMPVAFLLGVPWSECRCVGQLLGVKTFVNEFAAFAQFSAARGRLSERTQLITTFALCGFANPGSIGVMVSTLSALAPARSALITRLVFRAFVSGTFVCFLTACTAGMLSAAI